MAGTRHAYLLKRFSSRKSNLKGYMLTSHVSHLAAGAFTFDGCFRVEIWDFFLFCTSPFFGTCTSVTAIQITALPGKFHFPACDFQETEGKKIRIFKEPFDIPEEAPVCELREAVYSRRKGCENRRAVLKCLRLVCIALIRW